MTGFAAYELHQSLTYKSRFPKHRMRPVERVTTSTIVVVVVLAQLAACGQCNTTSAPCPVVHAITRIAKTTGLARIHKKDEITKCRLAQHITIS